MSDYYEFPIYVPGAASNAYLVHQAAYRLMLEPGKDCERDFIFDIESASDDNGLFALIRCARNRVPAKAEGAGIEVSPPASGRHRFHLRAVTRKRVTAKKNISINTYPERQDWLEKRAEPSGFKPIGLPKLTSHVREFFHQEHRFRITESVFTGLLEVVDAEKFHRAWRYGIGDQKGFGYGLISLSPAD